MNEKRKQELKELLFTLFAFLFSLVFVAQCNSKAQEIMSLNRKAADQGKVKVSPSKTDVHQDTLRQNLLKTANIKTR